jgi:hypothetical protein
VSRERPPRWHPRTPPHADDLGTELARHAVRASEVALAHGGHVVACEDIP